MWTDENGKKHYGDKPPESADVEVNKEVFNIHNVDEGYPYTDPELYKDQDETWSEKKRREARDQRAASANRRQAMAEPCRKARRRLSMMEGPVTFHDDDGKQIKTTERERQAIASALRAEIQAHCS